MKFICSTTSQFYVNLLRLRVPVNVSILCRIYDCVPLEVKILCILITGLEISVSHWTMTDKNKCLTDLKLFHVFKILERFSILSTYLPS